MGIYESCAPCGCIGETYTMYDPPKTAIKLRCPAHGGNADAYATAVAGRSARNWAGPENPYADADQQPNLESAADPLNLAADPQQNPE